MTKASRSVSLLVLGAAAFCSGTAYAQTGGGAGGAGGAPGGGPGADRFTLDVRGRVSYESNVAGGDDALANIRNLQPEDVIYTTGVTMTLQRPSSRQTLFLNAAADINRHDRNKRLDGENITVQAGATRRFTACAITGTAGYSRRQSQPDELTLVTVTKNVAETRTAGLQGMCGSGNFIGSVGGQVSKTNNNADSAGYVDSRTESVTGSVGYANQTLGTISLFVQHSTSSYSDLSIVGMPVARDFRQTGGGISYARRIGSRLNGTAAVSYTSLESDIEGGDSSGWTANAALNYRLSSRTGVVLNYFRGYQASATLFASSQFSERLDLSTSYKLSSRLSARASVSGSRNDFRGAQTQLLQVTEDKVFTFGGGLSYRVGRNITIGIDGGYTERNADVDLFDSNSTRASVSISNRF
jgi:hypothetical protein